jgi:hypothetical protein
MDINLNLYKNSNKEKVFVDLPVPDEQNILIKTDSGLIIRHKKSFYFYDHDILGYYARRQKSSWYIYPLTLQQINQIFSDKKSSFWKLKFESAINFGFFYNHYFINDKKTETIKFSTPLDGNQLNYPSGFKPSNMNDLNLSKFLLKQKMNDIVKFNRNIQAILRDIKIDSILEDV